MAPIPCPSTRLGDIPDPVARVAFAAVPPAVPPAEPVPTRADRRVRARAAVAFVVAWLAAAVMLFGLRPDVASAVVIVPLVVWVGGGAALLGVILRPRARGLPVGVRAVQHAVWIVPVTYAVVAMLVSAPAEGSLTWESIRGCLALSTLIAVGPLTAAALLLRGSFLSAPAWRGAAVGGLAGLAGSIGAHAHCPVRSAGHLLVAHGAAIAIGAAVGAALGQARGRS